MINKKPHDSSSKVFRKAAKPAFGETMEGWLAIHGISSAECVRILASSESDFEPERPQHVTEPPVPNQVIFGSAAEVLSLSCKSLERALGRKLDAGFTDRLRGVRTILDKEQVKEITGGTRALTVRRTEIELPVILCPFDGGIRDAMALVHEVFHAIQLIFSEERDVPPVQRELFAFIGEQSFIVELEQLDPFLAQEARLLWYERQRRIYQKDRADLLAQIANLHAPYRYGWNYALSQALLVPLAMQRVEAVDSYGWLFLRDATSVAGQRKCVEALLTGHATVSDLT